MTEREINVVAEPVIITDYDPQWPITFNEEKDRLSGALGDLAKFVDHVGSTSVPGLAAKPVIDIIVGLHREGDLDRTVRILEDLGYRYRWDLEDDLPMRRLFDRFVDGARTFHVHIVGHDSDFRWEHIAFRDMLRSRKDIAWAYGELKKGLAITYRDDRIAYTEAKTDFIQGVLEMAGKDHAGSRDEEGGSEC
jgi:GrpB-like predicted nucleotidyltransferase (UPF0157 family)